MFAKQMTMPQAVRALLSTLSSSYSGPHMHAAKRSEKILSRSLERCSRWLACTDGRRERRAAVS